MDQNVKTRCPVCGLYLADPPAGDNPYDPDDAPDNPNEKLNPSPWRRIFDWITDYRV